MLPKCAHCYTPFHPEKSTSALRNRFCSVLCERGALGFSIDGVIRSERRPRTLSVNDLLPDRWIDALLATLPAAEPDPEVLAAPAEPYGWKPGWRLYGSAG
jgi:hypothetical protein